VKTEAENADDDIAGVIDKVEVDQNVIPTLRKRSKISHHTHRQ